MWGLIIFAVLAVYIFMKRAQLLAVFARLKWQKGDTDKALRLFELAEKSGNMGAENRLMYGYALLRLGHFGQAREMLTLASMSAAKVPVKKRIKAMLALVEWKEGNISQAIEMLEEVIEDFKTSAVYQDLGLMYILNGDKEKALKFNLEAYDYNSDDLVITDNLAEAYVLCGEKEKAVEIYEKLLEKEPHFPEAYYGYGMLLIDMGERERGLDLIKQSLDKRFSALSVKSREQVQQLLDSYSCGA